MMQDATRPSQTESAIGNDEDLLSTTSATSSHGKIHTPVYKSVKDQRVYEIEVQSYAGTKIEFALKLPLVYSGQAEEDLFSNFSVDTNPSIQSPSDQVQIQVLVPGCPAWIISTPSKDHHELNVPTPASLDVNTHLVQSSQNYVRDTDSNSDSVFSDSLFDTNEFIKDTYAKDSDYIDLDETMS